MAAPYLQGSDFFIADAEKSDGSLNAEVWEHARRAESRGLAPMVEIWARSSELSRALDRWWRRGDAAVGETLAGCYLIRVNLATFGPEAIVRLTPFALAGVPLFLGWNPVGQVLTAREFGGHSAEELVLPLSAFVEDVLHGRPHSLNPRPRLANAKWDAALVDLRRSRKQGFQLPPRAPLESGPLVVASPLSRVESPTALFKADSAQASQAVASEATPRILGPVETVLVATVATVQQLHSGLEQVLAGARSKLEALAERLQMDLDYSLESLRRLDAYVDESLKKDPGFFEQNGEQIALIGIYLGDTVCHHAEAAWLVDVGEKRLSDALKLRTAALVNDLKPLSIAAELCADRSRSLFGHGVALCSGNWPA